MREPGGAEPLVLLPGPRALPRVAGPDPAAGRGPRLGPFVLLGPGGALLFLCTPALFAPLDGAGPEYGALGMLVAFTTAGLALAANLVALPFGLVFLARTIRARSWTAARGLVAGYYALVGLFLVYCAERALATLVARAIA